MKMKQLRWCVIRNNIYLGKLLRAKWLDSGNGSFTGTLLARELISDHLLPSVRNGEDLALLPVLSPFGNLLGYLSSASRVGGRLQTLLAMGWGDVWVMSMDLLTLPTSCLEARSNRPVDKEIQISFYHFSDLFFFSWKNKLDSISFPIWYKTLFWKMTNTASVYVNFGSLKSKLGLPCSPYLGTTGLSPFWQGQGLRWL